SSPLIFLCSIKNVVFHHNPFYPVALSFGGVHLPDVENAYHATPPFLANVPRPLRFVASILEIHARDFSSRRRWTIDMYSDDPDQNRLGGFFGVYVLFQLALLVIIVLRDGSRRARVF